MYVYVKVEGTSDKLTLSKLIGDCSTYNIGCVSSFQQTKEGVAALVSWLLSTYLSSDINGAWKLVFTNYDSFFSRSKLYELLESMSFAEHIQDINNYDEEVDSGPRENFQLRILEIDKRYDKVAEVFRSYIKNLTLPEQVSVRNQEESMPTTFIVNNDIQTYYEECDGEW